MEKCINEGCNNTTAWGGVCSTCRRMEEKNKILSMSQKEIEEKLHVIANNITEELVDDWLLPITCYFDVDTSACVQAAFDADILRPTIIYKNAPIQVRDEIIRQLESDEAKEYDLYLKILAWIGDEVVQERFKAWEKTPLEWRNRLFVGPFRYAEEAGWTFDENGKRINLYFDKAYGIVRGDTKADSAVKVAQFDEETCATCGDRLYAPLILDLSDDRLKFLGLDGILKVVTCYSCFCYSNPMYCKFDESGNSFVYKSQYESEDYTLDEETMEEMSNNNFVLSSLPVSIYDSAEYSLPSSFCQIGGLPAWVDDPYFHECPDCGKKMTFFAQLDDSFINNGVGKLFFDICCDCKVVGMSYQQT